MSIMKVKNPETGEWEAVTVSVSGLPSVSTDDNGKLLQVVDGAWAMLSVADSAVAAYVDDYISSALEGDY